MEADILRGSSKKYIPGR